MKTLIIILFASILTNISVYGEIYRSGPYEQGEYGKPGEGCTAKNYTHPNENCSISASTCEPENATYCISGVSSSICTCAPHPNNPNDQSEINRIIAHIVFSFNLPILTEEAVVRIDNYIKYLKDFHKNELDILASHVEKVKTSILNRGLESYRAAEFEYLMQFDLLPDEIKKEISIWVQNN